MISIPFSRGRVAKLCLRSRKRALGHLACFRIWLRNFQIRCQARGKILFFGGREHPAEIHTLSTPSCFAKVGDMTMVRMAASVLGRGAVSFPCAWDNCLLIRSSPVLMPMVPLESQQLAPGLQAAPEEIICVTPAHKKFCRLYPTYRPDRRSCQIPGACCRTLILGKVRV